MDSSSEQKSNRRILVVDDGAAIHQDLRKVLSGGSTLARALEEDERRLFGSGPQPTVEFEIDSAFQGKDGVALVEQAAAEKRPYALAFVDVRMPPGWDGIETVSRMWQADPEIQVVICTAYSDYSWDGMVSRLGCSDNLLILKKPFDSMEVIQLAHALTRKWELHRQAQSRQEELERMVEQRTAELNATCQKLRRSEERFAKAFLANPLPLAILRQADGCVLDVNERFEQVTGYRRDEVTGHPAADFGLTHAAAEIENGEVQSAPGSHADERETVFRTRAGDVRKALISTGSLSVEGTPHQLLMIQDLSEQSRTRDAQKLEAVRRLVAKVAHHFNNLHTAIQGNLEFCLHETQQGELFEALGEAAESSRRAIRVVRHLIAFSSQQPLRLEQVDLNDMLLHTRPQITNTLGPDIELRFELAHQLPSVNGDAVRLAQVVLQLVQNAREAMPDGGKLTVRTSLSPAAPGQDAPPSQACVSISDTGVGMEETTRNQLFEPFFTTKGFAAGRGMGLASAFGVVRQHGGRIEVESQPGVGSTFRLLLPVPAA